jgi:hypothetical protein
VLEDQDEYKSIYQRSVEIIYKINDQLKKDLHLMTKMEIEYNYLPELNHEYDIQLISNHDPIEINHFSLQEKNYFTMIGETSPCLTHFFAELMSKCLNILTNGCCHELLLIVLIN